MPLFHLIMIVAAIMVLFATCPVQTLCLSSFVLSLWVILVDRIRLTVAGVTVVLEEGICVLVHASLGILCLDLPDELDLHS